MRKKTMMPLLLCLAVIITGCGSQAPQEVIRPAAEQSTEEENYTMDYSHGMTCKLESADDDKMIFSTVEGKKLVIETALFNEKRSEGDHKELEIGDYVALYYNTVTDEPDGSISIDLKLASYFEMDASKYILR